MYNLYQSIVLDIIDQLTYLKPSRLLKKEFPEHIFLAINQTKPIVILTHDCDFYFKNEYYLMKYIRYLECYIGLEPINMIKRYIELEDLFGYSSTFIVPLSRFIHRNLLFKLSGISSRFDIGFHPFPNQLEFTSLRLAKELMEKICKTNIISTRVHMIPWSKHIITEITRAGFAIDSSFGYNNAIGFRYNIGIPFKPYGLNIIEVPLALMDVCIFRDVIGDYNLKIKLVRKFLEAIKGTNACFTINWHVDYAYRTEYIKIYDMILSKLSQIDAVVLNMREAKAFIEKNCEIQAK